MPEFLIDRLELRGRPLEISKLVLAPAAGETAQSIGAHAMRAESLSEEVDDRLVERLPLRRFSRSRASARPGGTFLTSKS